MNASILHGLVLDDREYVAERGLFKRQIAVTRYGSPRFGGALRLTSYTFGFIYEKYTTPEKAAKVAKDLAVIVNRWPGSLGRITERPNNDQKHTPTGTFRIIIDVLHRRHGELFRLKHPYFYQPNNDKRRTLRIYIPRTDPSADYVGQTSVIDLTSRMSNQQNAPRHYKVSWFNTKPDGDGESALTSIEKKNSAPSKVDDTGCRQCGSILPKDLGTAEPRRGVFGCAEAISRALLVGISDLVTEESNARPLRRHLLRAWGLKPLQEPVYAASSCYEGSACCSISTPITSNAKFGSTRLSACCVASVAAMIVACQ